MHDKLSKWVDLFERIVNLIRIKAYNTIAKLVIGTGLVQIAESQVKIFHALVIALFEEYIGKSDILRSFLSATSDPSIGLVLVVGGLIYHLIVTLGKDYIDTRKAELPKYPLLQCRLLNGNKEELSRKFTIRGKFVNLPYKEDIPDYKDVEPNYDDPLLGQIHRMTAMYNSPFGNSKNEHLYRERANLLDEWAGAELLYLNVINDSSVLASGVSIKLTIPRHKGLFISMPGRLPKNPQEEIESIGLITPHFHSQKIIDLKAISVESDSCNYYVSWSVMKIQAQTVETSTGCILLKSDKPVEIECVIYCDELPEPVTSTFIAIPPSETVGVSVEQLIDKESFSEVSYQVIMDGYELKEALAIYEEYEMERAR